MLLNNILYGNKKRSFPFGRAIYGHAYLLQQEGAIIRIVPVHCICTAT